MTFLDSLPEELSVKIPSLGQWLDIKPVGGGDINEAYQIRFSEGRAFLKVNEASRFPEMFRLEADALKSLKRHSGFRIPETYGWGSLEGKQWLLMKWLDSRPPTGNFWLDFAEKLAYLHWQSAATFGWPEDNYIGSLVQANAQKDSWTEFYAECRLMPMAEKAARAGFFAQGDIQKLEKLINRLPEICPPEPPAHLHGDLWSGNYLCSSDGEPVLIDPAVYYGHREMDLAMMRLFGGFPQKVFDQYEAVYPLTPGFSERVSLWQLFPLLVHLNLFGSAYLGQCRSIIGAFS